MGKNNKIHIHIFALAAQGVGISGSDRIFIEFARRWSKENLVTIYVDREGYVMCQKQNLVSQNVLYEIINLNKWKQLGFAATYFARIFSGIRLGLSTKVSNNNYTIIYSASEFWMDALPAWILKLRFSKITWAAAWYQTAPNPLKGFAEGQRTGKYRVSAFLYWFMQLPIKPLVAHLADFVMINNETEKKQFPSLNSQKKALVVIGAVDLSAVEIYKKKFARLPKIYDGVFQGRFHPQKGVVELVTIWKEVVIKKPKAKLVMIGDGPLMNEVRLKIKDLGLNKNIILLGYVFDGEKKYKTFAQSKMVVHPAFYDSGGMAAAEAMVFGLPCVGFSLKSYESYYPQGMVKVKIGDLDAFAKTIIKFLDDEKLRSKIGQEAVTMIQENWSWDKRAEDIFTKLQ